MFGRDVFSAWKLEPLSTADFQRLDGSSSDSLGKAGLLYLLRFSLLAPTTHNSVPQTYALDVEGQRVTLALSRRHVLPASDPTGREALISIGCAVENLVQAAGAYGFEASWTIDPALCWERATHSEVESCARVGEVAFQRSRAPLPDVRTPDALRLLCERKVIRAEFDAALRLPRNLVRELEAAAALSSSVRLHLFETDREKFAWGKLDELATKHKLEQRAFQVELGRCLLSDDDTTTARGMRGREFGFDALVGTRVAAQLRGEVAMAVDQLAFMARAARAGLTSSSAVCALSCLDSTPGSAVEAGRVYQRATLGAFRSGYANAVHTAVCEVPHVRKMCEATLLGGHTPTIVFRLGRPLQAEDWLRPHSSRPSLEDLVQA
jgi:hypothetical protein